MCARLGATEAAVVLSAHQRSWVTAADLTAVAAVRLTAVRLPVGHWGVVPPRGGDLHVCHVWGHLDDALDWAAAVRVEVLLDVHAHPEGQRGEAHTGRARGGGGTWTKGTWTGLSTLSPPWPAATGPRRGGVAAAPAAAVEVAAEGKPPPPSSACR